jgi:hypothetical protein
MPLLGRQIGVFSYSSTPVIARVDRPGVMSKKYASLWSQLARNDGDAGAVTPP